MSNSRIGLSFVTLLSLLRLCIKRSVPVLYLVGEYPVHHGKLDAWQLTTAIYESCASVLIITGDKSEGPDDVLLRSLFTSSRYCENGTGCAVSSSTPPTA
eukprot:5105738-Ditylum_brightwellii.AAC.1